MVPSGSTVYTRVPNLPIGFVFRFIVVLQLPEHEQESSQLQDVSNVLTNTTNAAQAPANEKHTLLITPTIVPKCARVFAP